MSTTGRLTHLPLPLFAAPMGIGGLGLAWREAGRIIDAPFIIGEGLLLLAGFVWLLVFGLHILRALRHPEALTKDLRHPVRSAFAGAITINLMILAGGLTPHNYDAAIIIWVVAVVFHLTIGVWTVRGLILPPCDASALTPPLLIPLVGNMLAPVFGVHLGLETVSWMFFGIGALLWVLIQPLLLWRLLTGPNLPKKLFPTLTIFIAPPAIGSIALASLMGEFGVIPLSIFGLAVFMALVLMTMVRDFFHVPFAISWWSWTFPTAAFTVAALKASHAYHAAWHPPALWVLLIAVSSIIMIVSSATVKAAFSGHLLQPE